jgi:hypothetical protein
MLQVGATEEEEEEEESYDSSVHPHRWLTNLQSRYASKTSPTVLSKI